MNLRFRTNKSKLFVSCIILIPVVITIILSQERIWLDTSIRKGIKKLSESNNSQTRISPFTSEDVFNVKMKTDLMKIIKPSNPKYALTVNGPYLLENKDHCTSVTRLTTLIMVLSAPKHFQNRNVIRKTWGNGTFYSLYGTTRVLFLLGTINDSEVQGNIEEEFKLYGDIIQGPFIDSYHNLSHKSVMGYKWATERCKNAKYVIKTDDDIVINMFHVLQSDIAEMSVNQNYVHCLRLYNSYVFRDKGYIVYEEPNQFQGLKYYPPYCHGQYVMMLNDLVPYLYESASKSPLFWSDDVFVYGIAMDNIPSLKYKELKFYEYVTTSYFYYFLKLIRPEWHYLYHVTQNVNQMMDIWSAISKHFV